MTDLRAFLRRHIEAFLDHEFGPGTLNMTPSGIRRILWTSDHTNHLVHHLAENWEMVEETQRLQQDDAAEESKRGVTFKIPPCELCQAGAPHHHAIGQEGPWAQADSDAV